MAKRNGVKTLDATAEAAAINVECEDLEKAVARKKKLLKEKAELEARERLDAERVRVQADEDDRQQAEEDEARRQAFEEREASLAADERPAVGQPVLSQIEKVIQDLSGEGSFEIYQLVAGTPVMIGRYDIADYPDALDTVARQKGGGDFKVKIRSSDGRQVKTFTRTFDKASYSGSERAASSGPSQDWQLKMFEMMQAAQAEHRREMEVLRQQNERMALEREKMFMETLKTVQGPNRTFDEIAKIGSLFKSDQAKSPWDGLKELIEMKHMLAEDLEAGPERDPITSILDRIIKAVSPFIEAGVASVASRAGGMSPSLSHEGANGPSSPARPRLPAPTGNESGKAPTPTAAAPQSAPPPASNPPVDPKLKVYAAMLYSAAASRTDPASLATQILDSMSEDDIDEFAGWIEDPGVVGQLIAVEPLLKDHQSWLVELVRHLNEELNPEAAEASEIANATA